MSSNMEQLRTEWQAELARIEAQIDDLKARIDTESRMLYARLCAEIATLQSDIRTLAAEVDAAGPDAYARQTAAQIEELRAKGDAAYSLLRAGLATELDPFEVEIRQLETAAIAASGDARAKLITRIDELKSAQIAAQASRHASALAEGTTDVAD